ncbi:Spi family protease inhibitor, partial [Cellulomonas carbonis]
LVLLLVAMTTSLQGFAIVRSQQVMKEIANRQLQQMGINGMVTLATETNTYAIYRSAMQGFVVVGKTSEGRAVLGYSKTNFDAKHLPCGLKWWLKA